ncbi:hypothetical protein [Sphingomonas sp. Leaf34]|uniref:hypothetical protein n=1 Tax=Sphingomonas sp. Leaf34 TaxID=1736216 RepID=UPI0012E262ED|nr:hypothetical protein [Sphingomonas sp. Leaf34]
MTSLIHEEPSDVKAEAGSVHISGPGGVVVSLSVEAAEETSERILQCALEARGQQILGEGCCHAAKKKPQ